MPIDPLVWTPIETLEDSWLIYGENNPAPAYYLDNRGRVFLRGLIRGGVANAGPNADGNTKICDLPEGIRPPQIVHLSAATRGGSAVVSIDVDGQVWALKGWSSSFLSLSGLVFFTS